MIQLSDGKYFDFLNPSACAFNIETIAHALSNICRYTGHCSSFYSVAQHSYLVSLIVPNEHQLAALLHDAAEAFLGDVSQPLKKLLPDYQRLELLTEQAIFKHFDIPFPLDPCIKEADLRILVTESRDLMKTIIRIPGYSPVPIRVKPWEPAKAKMYFLRRYNELT